MWCIPPKNSAEFVAQMEDVLEVHHRPYAPRRPVLCMDETFTQLIGEVREPLPAAPGRVERFDSVYVRNGVASLFTAFEPLAGRRQVEITDTRKRGDRARFIRGLLDGPYRSAEKVVLVMDQSNTHGPASLYEGLRAGGGSAVGGTPGDSSHPQARKLAEHGRNRTERLGARPARAGRGTDRPRRARSGLGETKKPGPGVKAVWQFTTADARIKLRKLYPTVDG